MMENKLAKKIFDLFISGDIQLAEAKEKIQGIGIDYLHFLLSVKSFLLSLKKGLKTILSLFITNIFLFIILGVALVFYSDNGISTSFLVILLALAVGVVFQFVFAALMVYSWQLLAPQKWRIIPAWVMAIVCFIPLPLLNFWVFLPLIIRMRKTIKGAHGFWIVQLGVLYCVLNSLNFVFSNNSLFSSCYSIITIIFFLVFYKGGIKLVDLSLAELDDIDETSSYDVIIFRKYQLKKYFVKVVCVILIAFVVAMSGYSIFSYIYSQRVEEKQQSMAKNGFFFTTDELIKNNYAPENSNLSFYKIKNLLKNKEDKRIFNIENYKLDENTLPKIEKLLAENQDIELLLEKWINEDFINWNIAWKDNVFVELPHLRTIVKLGNYLSNAARVAIANGDMNSYKKYDKYLSILSERANSTNTIISFLVASRVEKFRFKAFGYLCESGKIKLLSKDYLLEILKQSQNASSNLPKKIRAMFINETAMISIAINNENGLLSTFYDKETSDSFLCNLILNLYLNSHFGTNDKLYYLNVYEKISNFLPNNYAHTQDISEIPSMYYLSEFHVAHLSAMLIKITDELARIRCKQVIIATELYRRDNGKFPKNIESLVPKYLDAIPKDPFTDKIFSSTYEEQKVYEADLGNDDNITSHTKRKISGFSVYSIGEKLTEKNKEKRYDIVLSLTE